MECTQNRSENMSEKATTEKSKTEKTESLPEGWKRVRLGEVIEEVNERVGKKNLEPVAVGINGIKKRSDIYYKELAEDYSNNKILRTGYIAFGLGSNEMAIGVNFFENDFCVSPAYKVFKIKDQDILFSHYFFDFFKRIVGSKFLILSARQGKAVDFILLLNEYVLLPPLTEQQKIAEILETVDNAIEKTDAIIEKYRRIKKGLMADLLTGKIRLIPYGHSEAEGEESPLLTSPEAKKFVIGDKTFVAVPNQKWKNTPIGKIPEDWEVRKLGEIGEIVSGYTFPISFQGKDYGQYPFVKVDDLNIDNKFILGAKNYIDDYERNFLGIMVFPSSTIVFPKIGMAVYLNKFRILKVNAVFDNNITGVIFKGSICIPEFYYFYFAAK
jgi:type I restriction enzyme S subunit